MDDLRIGIGFDAHPFIEGRALYLGGVEIPHPFGLAGHSDADVLIHAIIDSLLGASNLGDIGNLFPDTDEKFKNIRSTYLLGKTGELLKLNDIGIINIDSVIICEKPRIAGYICEMKKALSEALKISDNRIGIKGKTTEKLGFTGRIEGIAAQAVSLIRVK